MGKYYCDYCDVFLTHDSPSVRKVHNNGKKHREMVYVYYRTWMEQRAQKLVDDTTRAFVLSQRMKHRAQRNQAVSSGLVPIPQPVLQPILQQIPQPTPRPILQPILQPIPQPTLQSIPRPHMRMNFRYRQ
ncbi:U1 small nuclear ribonucleoprotein C [Aphelenchoides bicaudatus]|nr:U1 small nuclear ribonucleoprotein C [Aphelenchoides bicaudatus]